MDGTSSLDDEHITADNVVNLALRFLRMRSTTPHVPNKILVQVLTHQTLLISFQATMSCAMVQFVVERLRRFLPLRASSRQATPVILGFASNFDVGTFFGKLLFLVFTKSIYSPAPFDVSLRN